jgi:hypothetical protein
LKHYLQVDIIIHLNHWSEVARLLWPSCVLAKLDSPTEESECELIAFADDFEAEFDAIVSAHESGALPLPPPPTMTTAPQAEEVDFAVCRKQLSEFFLKRSDKTKKGEATYWSLYETLPGKGRIPSLTN